MKASIAITLIITGAAVVAIPPLSTAWQTFVVLHAAAQGVNASPWLGEIGDLYRIGCWALGAAMIFVAIIPSLSPESSAHPDFAHTSAG